MFVPDRPLSGRLLRTPPRAPVLSVMLPTFHRPAELTVAVKSIADQVDADLQGKVEIIVSDNASGEATRAVLAQLAETYPFLSYYIHAENYGGNYQVCSAPHRALGRWTWVFGDDDALAPGGLRAIIEVLERDEPGFLTVNRQVWNKTLDQCLAPSRHDLPDVRFDSFVALLELFGFDQLSFFTSQIYATEPARALDASRYMQSPCRYVQLAYYVEAFHAHSAYYLSAPVVLHRWDAGAGDVHAANFHHLATLLPELVQMAGERAGLGPDLFERISGRRSLMGPETQRVTFVDNILQNLWRSVAVGTAIPEEEWSALHQLSPGWRPGRAEALIEVHDAYAKVYGAALHLQALIAEHNAPAAPGAEPDLDHVKQSEAAIHHLRGMINNARQMAGGIAAGFGG